jgi:hypothetical protein
MKHVELCNKCIGNRSNNEERWVKDVVVKIGIIIVGRELEFFCGLPHHSSQTKLLPARKYNLDETSKAPSKSKGQGFTHM